MNYIISFIIGTLISIMILVNGLLSTAYGNYYSSVLIHLIGLTATLAIIVLKKYPLKFKKNIPFYLYIGGVIGVFTVLSNNISFTSIGVSLTIAIGLLGQSISSVIVDHYGLLGAKKSLFNKNKLVGLLIVIVGITVMTIY